MPNDLAKTVAELRALMAKATPDQITILRECKTSAKGFVQWPVPDNKAVSRLVAQGYLCGSNDGDEAWITPAGEFYLAALDALPILLAAAERAPAAPDVGEVGKLASHLAHMACFGGGKYTEFLTKEKVREAATALERQAAQVAVLTAELEKMTYARDPFDSTKRGLAYKDLWNAALELGIDDMKEATAALAAAREENARLQTALDAATESNRRIYVALTAEREKNGTEMPGADDYEEAAHE